MTGSEWGRRAAALYRADYATSYRKADDEIDTNAAVQAFGLWLRRLSESFGRDITVLDLGCGTGRYFWALRHVRELVGVDASAAMLAEARTPVRAGEVTVAKISLIEGDFLAQDFAPGRFDMIYSIGVLAEHSPLDDRIVGLVARWLAPGGLFAFTAVHPQSFSVKRTWKRRAGEVLLPFTTGSLHAAIRSRILGGGLYADEARLRQLLPANGLSIESIEKSKPAVHEHLLCVARKAA